MGQHSILAVRVTAEHSCQEEERGLLESNGPITLAPIISQCVQIHQEKCTCSPVVGVGGEGLGQGRGTFSVLQTVLAKRRPGPEEPGGEEESGVLGTPSEGKSEEEDSFWKRGCLEVRQGSRKQRLLETNLASLTIDFPWSLGESWSKNFS